MLKTTAALLEEESNLKSNENVQVLWGVILLFLSAQLRIPLDPVPITFQTFGVLLLGLFFKPKMAVKSIVVYLSLGAIGVPVFASLNAGLVCFLSPSAGYLIGFLVAVLVMTAVRKKYSHPLNLPSLISICLLGSVAIYSCGILWLARFMDFNIAISVGLLPFLFFDFVKLLLVSITVRYILSPMARTEE